VLKAESWAHNHKALQPKRSNRWPQFLLSSIRRECRATSSSVNAAAVTKASWSTKTRVWRKKREGSFGAIVQRVATRQAGLLGGPSDAVDVTGELLSNDEQQNNKGRYGMVSAGSVRLGCAEIVCKRTSTIFWMGHKPQTNVRTLFAAGRRTRTSLGGSESGWSRIRRSNCSKSSNGFWRTDTRTSCSTAVESEESRTRP
jgi:hypothetical protein